MKNTTNFSKIGFILSALGSAIGLGHIWRFPYMAGANGGGAFVLLFLAFALTIGVSLLIGEMIIGNKGGGSVVSSYKNLDPTKSKKWYLLSLFVIGGPLILTFYSVVLGWVLYYTFVATFNLPVNLDASSTAFTSLISDRIIAQTICLFVIVALTAYLVIRGVKSGIEKANYILMPLLFVIFIGLLFYAMSFDSFSAGVRYMFKPDFSKITTDVVINALGQMFFSLSLGLAILVTYASETEKKQNLFTSSLWVVLPGIFISLVAGVVIFTFVEEFKANPGEGAGLVFVTLPLIFKQMGSVGILISFLFMIGLLFAGITSTVSLLEPGVKILEDRFKISRAIGSTLISIAIFIVGFLVILSINKDFGTYLTFNGKSLFDILDLITSNYLIVLGGLGSCIFVGWIIKKEALREFTKDYFTPVLFIIWLLMIRFVAPVVILGIFYQKLIG